MEPALFAILGILWRRHRASCGWLIWYRRLLQTRQVGRDAFFFTERDIGFDIGFRRIASFIDEVDGLEYVMRLDPPALRRLLKAVDGL